MIIVNTGEGKGKTTAAIGASIRMAGHNRQVLFSQFLKDNTSGECQILAQIAQIELLLPKRSFGFTFQMDESTRREAKEFYSNYFEAVVKESETGDYAMVVLDEIIGAINTNMVDERTVLNFLQRNKDKFEIILTGRAPSEELQKMADYVTDMKKIKHPFDLGIATREGIEK